MNIWNYTDLHIQNMEALLCPVINSDWVIIRWLIKGRKRNEYIWETAAYVWYTTHTCHTTHWGEGDIGGHPKSSPVLAPILSGAWQIILAGIGTISLEEDAVSGHWNRGWLRLVCIQDDCCVHFSFIHLFFRFVGSYISILRIQGLLVWRAGYLIILMIFYWDLQYGI